MVWTLHVLLLLGDTPAPAETSFNILIQEYYPSHARLHYVEWIMVCNHRLPNICIGHGVPTSTVPNRSEADALRVRLTLTVSLNK